MHDAQLIYLLSVSDNIKDTFDVLGKALMFFACMIYAITHIRHWIIIGNTFSDSKKEEMLETYKADELIARKNFFVKLGIIGVCWLLSAACPSVENVLRAYALIEGSKVINADNAELAAEAVGKRFDKFLDIVDRGINGRKPEPVPTPTPDTPAPAK